MARRRSLGAAKSSSTGWLLGIGAVAAIVGGVWYWRSRSQRLVELRAKLICGLDNARRKLGHLQQSQYGGIDAELDTITTTGDIQFMQNGLRTLDDGYDPGAIVMQTAAEWCSLLVPSPSGGRPL